MKNRKKALITVGILILISIVIGISYAYWILTYGQTGMNKVSSSCFSLSIINEKNDINLQKQYPILDSEGQTLTPYSFTITNTCDLFASFTVNLEVLENTTMPTKYIKIMLNKEATQKLDTYESTTTTLDGSIDSKILATGSLGAGDSVDYTLRLWMDENTPAIEDAMNKNFYSKIAIQAAVSNYSPMKNGYTKLSDAILANEYQTTPEISKQKIASKQAVDFSKTAPMIDWQENHASSTSETTATMPHPDLVGNGESYTANLTNENILLRIGTSYTFDAINGKYTIGNFQYIDPTTITDYNSKDYYFCQAGFNTNANDLIQPFQNYNNCSTIYKVTSATASDSQTTGSGGTVIKTRIFKINGYAYTQSELESDKSDKGLYQMNDRDGTSYYYRGSVANNYVKFGDFYWRIIRINGDGSVRLLYAGTSPNATGDDLNTKLTDATLGYTNKTTAPFNTIRDNPGYVGYMYGNTLNSTYAETNANENDSSIKKYLDSWYKQNILDKGLSNYISDNGFCNDRSLASTTNYPNNGDGVQITGNNTLYGGYERYYKTKQPTLVCPNESSDLFTISSSTKGNQKLTYPIGLITVDELMLSGLADGYLNRFSYTYSSSAYWTLSSGEFYVISKSTFIFVLAPVGSATINYVTNSFGIRPVISLSSDTQITSGIGTSNDPFVVKTT